MITSGKDKGLSGLDSPACNKNGPKNNASNVTPMILRPLTSTALLVRLVFIFVGINGVANALIFHKQCFCFDLFNF